MGYGKNKERKDWLMRAPPLGIGKVTRAKDRRMFALRDLMLPLMRKMAIAGFLQEPLASEISAKELDARLLTVQTACDELNSVYREQARMRVKPALEEATKRYLKKLAGSLRFVDQKIPESERTTPKPSADGATPEPQRIYFNVPAEVQDVVTAADLAALKKIGEVKLAIEAFKRVIVDGDLTGFSENQLVILRFIHARTQEKHTPPEFAAKDKFTLQLHIDSRMLPTGQKAEALELRNGVAFFLKDDNNKRYHRFLDLAGVAPRDARIRIPLVLSRKIAKRLESTRSEWASLIVEISETSVGVRLVAGKPVPAVSTEDIFRVVGRDFGYKNTITLSVAESAVALDLEKTRAEIAMLDNDKDASREFILGRDLPQDVKILERKRFCGKDFLDRASKYCKQIDGTKSKIDLAYNRLDKLKQDIAVALNLQTGDLITKEMKRSEQGEKVREFFATFGLINDLKQARRALYRKIAALKKNWFGFLSNIETQLALKYHAAIVRENLTVLTVEVDSPEYKGRTFNKMLNNGSKGQYQNRASDKFEWHGVPEIEIPSFFTSRSCLPHSTIVEKKHRNGENIFFPCCGKHDHADEHAADTIAQYVFLRPRLPGRTTGPVSDKHAFC